MARVPQGLCAQRLPGPPPCQLRSRGRPRSQFLVTASRKTCAPCSSTCVLTFFLLPPKGPYQHPSCVPRSCLEPRRCLREHNALLTSCPLPFLLWVSGRHLHLGGPQSLTLFVGPASSITSTKGEVSFSYCPWPPPPQKALPLTQPESRARAAPESLMSSAVWV